MEPLKGSNPFICNPFKVPNFGGLCGGGVAGGRCGQHGVIYVGTSERNCLARNEKYLYLLGRDVELLQDGNF